MISNRQGRRHNILFTRQFKEVANKLIKLTKNRLIDPDFPVVEKGQGIS